MTKEKEALKLALSALEGWVNHGKWVWPETALEQAKRNTTEALTAIREVLAQPEQEPAAWLVYTQDGQSVYVTDNPTDIQKNQRALPMYTTPPASKPWVGLTDAQIGAVAADIWGSVLIAPQSYQAFARALEAAHGIKGDA